MAKERATQRAAEPGPVSVADLVAKCQGDDESPLPSRPTRMYRAIAVLAGFVLLCGAVAASTAALSGPRAERAVPGSATGSITGADALYPDLINASVGPPPLAPAPPPADDGDQDPAPGGDVPTRPAPADTPQSPPRQDSTAPDDLPTADADPATPNPRDPPATGVPEPPGSTGEDRNSGVLNSAQSPILHTVELFYETAPRAPRQAFDLLDPQMRGAGYEEFQQAWAGVREAEVEDIRPDGPDAALVIVRLDRDDGTMLHTLQHVRVTPGEPPRIVEVTLLSASRS